MCVSAYVDSGCGWKKKDNNNNNTTPDTNTQPKFRRRRTYCRRRHVKLVSMAAAATPPSPKRQETTDEHSMMMINVTQNEKKIEQTSDTKMAEIDLEELLFFDTFSHEANEDINLDLVQFPKPVYITEVRIIPLGARVQADFPGGVRLGATNPSKFGIEFFVNDLGKPGASTFECLGNFEYNQNNCINLECQDEKIPTDGLVLRGWYSTITLAVYGTLTKHVAGQIASPPQTPSELAMETNSTGDVVVIGTLDVELRVVDEILPTVLLPSEPIVYDLNNFQETFDEHCTDSRPTYNEENFYNQSSSQEGAPPSRLEHDSKRISRKLSPRSSEERSLSGNRTYSVSNDREFTAKKREWSRSPEYRHSRRPRSERLRNDSESHLSEHKRPRTPPSQIDSPHRPLSPDETYTTEPEELYAQKTDEKIRDRISSDDIKTLSESPEDHHHSDPLLQLIDEDAMSEQFEPILSDDEILGDDDSTNNLDNDLDIEMEDINFENVIKIFDPFKMPLNLYKGNLKEICAKDVVIFKNLFIKFLVQTRSNSIKEFLTASMDEKENFVNLCESLVNQLIHVNHCTVRQKHYILDVLFKGQMENLKLASNILKVALDFQCASSQPQPGYKIRHIKIGPRLAELLASSPELLQTYFLTEKMDLFRNLFDLYLQSHMALSIKLIILRAIYAILDTKFGVNIFLSRKANGYQQLLLILQNNPLTRAKYALKAIMKKLNLFEALENVHHIVTINFVDDKKCIKIDEIDLQTLEFCLQEIIEAISCKALCFQQPKRFLPVSNKFEIISDPGAWQSWANMLQSYFKEHLLCETLLLIISNQNVIPASLLTISLELLSTIVKSQIGIDYLMNYTFKNAQLLVNCLLGCEELCEDEYTKKDENGHAFEKMEEDETIVPSIQRTMQKLGCEIAYKIQTRFHLDSIAHNRDNPDILCEHLHALHSQLSSNPGRKYTTEVLGFNYNILPIINLIERERKYQSKRLHDSPGSKYKSPVLSYSIDLLDCFIRNCTNLEYLMDNGQILLDLVKSHEFFDSSVSIVLQEMAAYLKPFEIVPNFDYNGVTTLFEVIKRSIEYITTFPGDLIMGLRILKHLIIPNTDKSIDMVQNKSGLTNELKFKYVMLQFYASDGIVILLGILEKLHGYFEQPGVHAPTLMTHQGTQTCQIILPTLQILKEMLTFLIQCRDTQFKDVTAIEHLMKTYFLVHYFPEKSQAYDDARKIQTEIIKILLAYTQPNEEGEEFVHKSLWTQMIREVIKNTLNGPATFIPGLKVLTELIPLPLPLHVLKPLNDSEKQRLVTERKLWSAHLHPESANITELIQTICPTTYPQLSNLLTSVCLQLSDLAPNMTLLVSRTIIDLIVTDYTQNSPVNGVGTENLAILLQCLGKLTIYPSIKISALSIFPGRPSELFNQLLTNTDQTESHLLCQINIHKILRNFFDSKISLNNPNCCGNLEFNLACALPSKELIPEIINSICINLLNSDTIKYVMIAALTNMILLTEHDITLFYLRQSLLNKTEEFIKFFTTTIPEIYTKDGCDRFCKNIIIFLQALTNIDETEEYFTTPRRTLKLSIPELINIIQWQIDNNDDSNNVAVVHSLRKIHTHLIEICKDKPELQEISDILSDLIDELDNNNTTIPESSDEITIIEPILPQAEGIVTQYLSRPIFTVCDGINETILQSYHWLELLAECDENEYLLTNQIKMTSCNLAEIVSTCMPAETNLQTDCKRILHLSASPQSNRERMPTAPCFRTRRVEVEPQTGRPEKKIFVSPMRGRGFSRTPPSRSDLFRSRPPNTSRPPSLHVDDFLALETCGAQPTGPTGYNKLSRDIIGIRGSRGSRSRGSRITNVSGGTYRTNSPNAWNHMEGTVSHPPPQHFRTATSEPVVTPHFTSDTHYVQSHFVSGSTNRSRGRGRGRLIR